MNNKEFILKEINAKLVDVNNIVDSNLKPLVNGKPIIELLVNLAVMKDFCKCVEINTLGVVKQENPLFYPIAKNILKVVGETLEKNGTSMCFTEDLKVKKDD